MVLAAVVSLFAVDDSAPAEVQIEASAPSTSTTAGSIDDELAAARVEQFAKAERSSRGAVITTTTTTAPPTTTTAAPTTTAKPTTTTAKPTTTTAKPTTTTAKPTTTSTMGPPPPCCRQEGGASYHDYPDIRTCAHKSLPKGTALKVTNLANGKVTSCVVNDRGPYVEGRILDLSREAFAEIAAISDGVIRVSIEW